MMGIGMGGIWYSSKTERVTFRRLVPFLFHYEQKNHGSTGSCPNDLTNDVSLKTGKKEIVPDHEKFLRGITSV
jgi:hypothetical protein